jgi:hypothetical protein
MVEPDTYILRRHVDVYQGARVLVLNELPFVV